MTRTIPDVPAGGGIYNFRGLKRAATETELREYEAIIVKKLTEDWGAWKFYEDSVVAQNHTLGGEPMVWVHYRFHGNPRYKG